LKCSKEHRASVSTSLLSFNDVFLYVLVAEACVPFFAGYAGVISGSRLWLYHELSAFNGTPKETVAYEKIQDCYKEQGVKSQTLEPQILVMSSLPLLVHIANIESCVQMINATTNMYQVTSYQKLKPLPTLAHVNGACQVHMHPFMQVPTIHSHMLGKHRVPIHSRNKAVLGMASTQAWYLQIYSKMPETCVYWPVSLEHPLSLLFPCLR
jgi:hypothetical protein